MTTREGVAEASTLSSPCLPAYASPRNARLFEIISLTNRIFGYPLNYTYTLNHGTQSNRGTADEYTEMFYCEDAPDAAT